MRAFAASAVARKPVSMQAHGKYAKLEPRYGTGMEPESLLAYEGKVLGCR